MQHAIDENETAGNFRPGALKMCAARIEWKEMSEQY